MFQSSISLVACINNNNNSAMQKQSFVHVQLCSLKLVFCISSSSLQEKTKQKKNTVEYVSCIKAL